jgi:polysaccharide biosynthesis/export protein
VHKPCPTPANALGSSPRHARWDIRGNHDESLPLSRRRPSLHSNGKVLGRRRQRSVATGGEFLTFHWTWPCRDKYVHSGLALYYVSDARAKIRPSRLLVSHQSIDLPAYRLDMNYVGVRSIGQKSTEPHLGCPGPTESHMISSCRFPRSPWAAHMHSAVTHCIRWGLMVAGLTLCAIQAARAEYRVSVGDVLEIAVAGVADLRHRAPVQLDGTLSVPLVGNMPVTGLPLLQIEAKVRAALATKVFRQKTPDGRETALVIEPDQVTVVVAEYRPIYVSGDVSKPGEYPYRPNITARQLIAVAGGYDIMHMRMNNPYLESADLRSEYGSLWTEFAQAQARLWRIKSELGEGSQITQRDLMDVPLPKATIVGIVDAETEYLKTREADYQQEKSFLQRGVREADEEVHVLSDQQRREEQGLQADQEELQKVSDLFGRGTLPSPRVTDARRAVLLSSTRKLQTAAQLMQVKRQQDETARKLEKLDDQRRLDLLHELQETSVKLNQIREKLQSVGDKLQYTAMVRSQLRRGAGSKPEIVVIRAGDKGEERLSASEGFELKPGDTVDVALQYEENTDSSGDGFPSH